MKTRKKLAEEKRAKEVEAEAKLIEAQLKPQLLGMIEEFKKQNPGKDGYMYISDRHIVMDTDKPTNEGTIIHVFRAH